MKTSVIIPSKNGLHHLKECLPSVINAAAKAPFETEIIIIDDNSNDNTFEVLPQIYSQIKVLKNPKQGASSARNFAVKHSSGNWLLFIDNDVFLEEDFFLKTAKYLQDDIFCVVNKYFLTKRSHFIVLNGFDDIYLQKESAELDFIYCGSKRGWKIISCNNILKQISCLSSKDYFSFICKNITSNKLLFLMIIKRIFNLNFLEVIKTYLAVKEKRTIEKINAVVDDIKILQEHKL